MRGLALAVLFFSPILAQSLKILPPALDDSGQKIFFGSSVTQRGLLPGADVYVLDAASQRRITRVSTSSNQSVTDFAVSADGSQLAYAAVKGTASTVDVVDLATGADHAFQFPPGASRPGSPHFIEGAGKILFNLFASPSPHTAAYGAPIFVANTDGTGLKHLHRGALAPGPQRAVSNNGLIVFTSADPFTTVALPQPPVNVYTMNLDGSNVHAITHFTIPPGGISAATIAASATISAAGDVVAFETFKGTAAGAPSQIWTVTSDGATLVPLTQPNEKCDSPSLAADGSRVAFVCRGQVYSELRNGSGRQALTHFRMSSASSPVISADGTRVLSTLGPVLKSAAAISGPLQQDSYGRGAIWSVQIDGTNPAPVYTPHVLTPGGVVDAITSSTLYPPVGGLITVFGANLAGDALLAATTAPGTPLPQSLNGVTLLVNGEAAPILAVTPWQINAQLPPDLADGPARFEIQFEDGSRSNTIHQEIRAISPHVLTLAGANSGDCQDGVFHAATGIPADAKHPASAGETVEIYATGLGPTRPQLLVGVAAPSSPVATLRYPVTVLLGGVPAPVNFAGLTPGVIGIYQINATIPTGLTGQRQQVTLGVNGGTLFTGSCHFSVR